MSTSDDGLFSFNTRLGLVFVVEASFLSAFAATSVLIYIAYSTIMRRWKTETEIHFYFVNLMIFDLIMAIGSLLDIKWIKEAQVSEEPFCRAQGAIKQFGNVGVALTSLAIAVHTLCVLAFRWTAPRRIALVAICLIWLFVILTIGITFGVHEGPVTYRGKVYTYYGDTKLWCWITQPFVEKQGIGLEYLWLWLAAFVDLLIYGFLALVVMNFVAVNENRRPRWVSNKERQMKNENSVVLSMDTRRSTAIRLSLYPLVYLVTVVPHSVARWTGFISDETSSAPPALTFSAAVFFSLNGLFNVILFSLTRPGVFPRRTGSHTRIASTESAENPQERV